MSGARRIISGELSKTKSKGSAFVSAIGSALSPEKIASQKPETQPVKGSKK